MQYEFPNEDIMSLLEEKECVDDEKWTMMFDGASNALGLRIGAVLITPEGQYIPFTNKLDFEFTNNIAKYKVCTMGVLAALEFKARVLEVYGDSTLEMKNLKLICYHSYIKGLMEHFEEITFHHIPCENNQLVDVLVTLSSMASTSSLVPLCSATPTHHQRNNQSRRLIQKGFIPFFPLDEDSSKGICPFLISIVLWSSMNSPSLLVSFATPLWTPMDSPLYFQLPPSHALDA
ncbi:hypothetical protein CR513_02250, partial [Mucuna pruriens]